MLFGEKDLTKPLAVIDWGGAQIVSLIFTAHFPEDHPNEDWETVPHGWTALGSFLKQE
jgi:hypothetical protein